MSESILHTGIQKASPVPNSILGEFFGYSAAASCVLDETGVIVTSNAAMNKLLGCAENILHGRRMAQMFVPGTAKLGAIANEDFDSEFALRCDSGREVWVSAQGRWLTWQCGRHCFLTLFNLTPFRQTEKKLRQAMLEQQALLENATIGILFSRNRAVVACNPLCAEMYGYAPSEMIGQSGQDLYPSDEAYETVGREAGPILASGHSYYAEIQQKRKDGSLFWCRISAKAVNPELTSDGTIWITEDITEERAVREALAQRTREMEAIFDTAVIGIAVVRDRQVLRCNRRFEELLGYSMGELNNQPVRLLYVSEKDYADIGAAAYSELQQGNLYQCDHLFQRKDGRRFWGRCQARAFDQSNPLLGSVWLFDDITDRREAEEKVRQALEQQEMIFNNAAVGIMFVRGRNVLRCNSKLEENFGYASGELQGKSVAVFYPSLAELNEHSQLARVTIRRGETYVGEKQLRRKDGSLLWVRCTARPIVGQVMGNGAGGGVIWIIEDVTERHLAEEALLRAHDELEQRVVERTSELVSTNVQLQEEIFERMRAEQRVWHIAHHDALTGLPNRSLLHDRFDHALVQAARSGQRLAVMFIDLDRFKSINDTLGHDVGDKLLQYVAERLRSVVRAVDTVARLGGDEFVVVLHEIQHVDDAVLVAEKIIAALGTALQLDGFELHATPSIGISVFPDDGSDAIALMKNADTAMYHAKAGGRNTFRLFTPNMDDEAKRSFGIEQRLRGALERGQFLLHYQPLIDHQGNRVSGMEALVRWQDPEQGMVPRPEFMQVAEETGLILPIGEWVLREACRQNGMWQALGYPALPVSVNLSPRQFHHKGLVDSIRILLNETGQPSELLELEINETSLMRDADETLSKLRQLADMGVRLAIDNFGSGYSSLAHLKRFPLHKLKISQDFVRDICHDRDHAAIVAAIVAMAQGLGLRTLAVGVETEEQLRMLCDFGCDQFQGYLFSQPLLAEYASQLFGIRFPESRSDS